MLTTNFAQKTIKIRKLSSVNQWEFGNPNLIYCGRHASKKDGNFDPEAIGLGNPFSHKPNSSCIWQVDSLSQCLLSYRAWLWKIIQYQNNTDALEVWEALYLMRFIGFCQQLEKIDTLVCFCCDRDHNTFNKEIVCHSQILWNAAVWFNTTKSNK